MNSEPTAGPSQATNPDLPDWTKSELFDLLETIKYYGSKDIDIISEVIDTKTPQQIEAALKYYKNKATQQTATPAVKGRFRLRKGNNHTVPLIGWAKFLNNALTFKDLHTETATALRLIAEFDNIPPAVATENVNFKNVYHAIANAMEGKAISDSGPMLTIINKCIIETALSSRAFIRAGALMNTLEMIDMSDTEINAMPRPTENAELATLRHLSSQRSYNPLNIPEEVLKPS